MNKITVLLLVFLKLAGPGFCQVKNNGFSGFWSTFQQSALNNDFNKLGTLTFFPLTIKGTLDNDPVKNTDQKGFPDVFKKYLQRPNFDYSGTEADDIKRKTVFSAAEHEELKTNTIRISDMVFKKIKGKWLLYLIYIDTEQ